MNPKIIPFALFGLFIGLGVLMLVARIRFNRKVRGSSQLMPRTGNPHQFQNEMANDGWRIRMIPYQEPLKTATVVTGGFGPYVSVLGVLGFVVGFALIFFDVKKYKSAGLALMIPSWLVLMSSIWFKARQDKRGWEVAEGRCLDRELRKVRSDGGWTWVWRIFCEYEHLGITYRVTPVINWISFFSEKGALRFLEKRISFSGQCRLRVNPKNPLQTELFGQGIKDKLLY